MFTQTMILEGIYIYMVTQRLPISVRVRASRSWWWLDCGGFGFASWILIFFCKRGSPSGRRWKKCWMHDQGPRKRSSPLFHTPGRLANIQTPAAINWNRLLNMRRCLSLLLLPTFGCFLIMYPSSNSNARKRPRSKAFAAQWEICMRCMRMKVP